MSSFFRFSFSSSSVSSSSLSSQFSFFSSSPLEFFLAYPTHITLSSIFWKPSSHSFFFFSHFFLSLPSHLFLTSSIPILPLHPLRPAPFPSVRPYQHIPRASLPHLSCPRGPCSLAPEHNAVPVPLAPTPTHPTRWHAQTPATPAPTLGLLCPRAADGNTAVLNTIVLAIKMTREMSLHEYNKLLDPPSVPVIFVLPGLAIKQKNSCLKKSQAS